MHATLIPGSRGIFDVAVDGAVIFSKRSAGRFPELAEMLSAIER